MNSLTALTKANKSSLAIKEGCVCPGHTLILECTVVAAQGGNTVWSGTAFDCYNSDNAIILFHTRFNNFGSGGEYASCNNGSIKAQNLRVDTEDTYISQLNVTINPNILGQTITCLYDEGTKHYTIGSVKLIEKGMQIWLLMCVLS